MAEEAFAGAGLGDEAAAEAGEGTSFESVFESVKTSLPGLGEILRSSKACVLWALFCGLSLAL